MTIRNVKIHGTPVFQNTKMDNLRKSECMCVNCALQEHCETNKALAILSQGQNVGLCVTRCPIWKSKGP